MAYVRLYEFQVYFHTLINWVFATNSYFLIHYLHSLICVQTLFDRYRIHILKYKCLRHMVAKIQVLTIRVSVKFSLPLFSTLSSNFLDFYLAGFCLSIHNCLIGWRYHLLKNHLVFKCIVLHIFFSKLWLKRYFPILKANNQTSLRRSWLIWEISNYFF